MEKRPPKFDPVAQLERQRRALREARFMLSHCQKALVESVRNVEHLVNSVIPRLKLDIPRLQARVGSLERTLRIQTPIVERGEKIKRLQVQIERLKRMT